MLSLLGGGAGVVLGIVGTVFVGRILGWPVQLTTESVLAAALFSITVGVCFGFYPARRASRLDPIVALRYE